MKYLKYLLYIIRHKWFVFVECLKLGIPVKGIMHDISKLRPSEFFPYAEYFYGSGLETARGMQNHVNPEIRADGRELESKINEAFDRAWLLHQHRNPHHYQWHVLREDSGATILMPMPEGCIREMVADWRGAGRAITGKDNTLEWYQANKNKMLLHQDTIKRVEELLGER